MKRNVFAPELVPNEASTRFLTVMNQLLYLPSRPTMQVYKQVAGEDYWRLRYAIRDLGGGKQIRPTIYLGVMPAAERSAMAEEINRLWPPDETRKREEWIDVLKVKRLGMRQVAESSAENLSGYFRGYILVMGPQFHVSAAEDQESLLALHDSLTGVQGLNTEIYCEQVGLLEMAVQGLIPISATREHRKISSINALISAVDKTSSSLERVRGVMKKAQESEGEVG